MDTINILATIYKQELAEANENKVLFKFQLEIEKQKNKELEDRIQNLEEELRVKEERINELLRINE